MSHLQNSLKKVSFQKSRAVFPLLALCVTLWSCSDTKQASEELLFESLSPESTHIQFTNQITDEANFNIFNYRNFYNGGGVAIGDINNDGLPDVFLVANMGDNRLFLNKGNLQFEDITAKAGIAGKRAWSTGVTFADVNGDGWLDIYVCNAGNRPNDDRSNELFINNRDLTFSEKAAAYGVDDSGFSTHAAFFDYDRDGDLDLYLLNNSFVPVSKLGYQNLRNQRDPLGGDKLFRNELISGPVSQQGKPATLTTGQSGAVQTVAIPTEGPTKFTDVSEQAGIYGSMIGFGLGITIGDVNNDNWLDIYISNDFYERDYLYLNNQDGTFKEVIKEQMPHLSLSSMGADVADINNDGNLDIFVTDMLPGNDTRLKTVVTFENYDLEQLKLSRDFHYQYMQNMLHLNNGDGTFSEIARLAGVHATDWSWGALIFDMDNDGMKDIFVANGIYKDLTDQDFVSFLADEKNMEQVVNGKAFNSKEFLDKMGSKPLPNYAYKNKGQLSFENKATAWGLGEPSFSNGAAYGDLDNDGDQDLVVNNVNQPVSVFKNLATEKLKTHYLRVKLTGSASNRDAIGAKVYVHQAAQTQLLQQMPNRGFQSSVNHVMVVGLGNNPKIDSVTVIWPDDTKQVIRSVKADQQLPISHADADQLFAVQADRPEKPLVDVTQQAGLTFRHEENSFIDYNRDALLKQMYSTLGPALAVGDVNSDGREDVFIGGASYKRKSLFVHQANGTFRESQSATFMADSVAEAVDATFFDADGDKDLDLFVVTGGNELILGGPGAMDLLYLNDGKGNFTKDSRFPAVAASGSCVAAADFDRDGDLDLFVGGRLLPGQYGYTPPSFLYSNDGKGNFTNAIQHLLGSAELGMITDAVWADVNGDQYPELLVVGDWMPITVLENRRGKLVKKPTAEISNSSGWWNCIKPADIDADGDLDFVVGNWGRNSRIIASKAQPAELYVHDFDQNGVVEQIINCYTEDGKSYPMVLKHDLQKQVPMVKKRFVQYKEYAGKQIDELFDAADLKGAVVKQVTNPNTSLLVNDSKGHFSLEALPIEAQYSPIFAIETLDYNHDGKLDLLLAGNFFDVLPEIGRYDANYGLLLQGKGNRKFEAVPSNASGFSTRGQIRKMHSLKGNKNQNFLILGKNGEAVQLFGYTSNE